MSVPVIEFKQVSVSVPVQGQSVELLRKLKPSTANTMPITGAIRPHPRGRSAFRVRW